MNNLNRILHKVAKPARYTGGEWNSIVKDWTKIPIRIALSYPDLYEIGMSNMALPILYEILNNQPDVLAERVFAPWVDMAAEMKAEGIPLFSLESKRPLKEFDILGFSLGYELTYTNVLNILHLAEIPIFASERSGSQPIVIAGGSCALNPEPMSDFIDIFIVGDGEEVLLELVDSFRFWKRKKESKENLFRQIATIPGIYIPSLYLAKYQANGLLKSITPIIPEASSTIQRRIINRLPPPITKPVVPYVEVVHDRGGIEIQRGCSRGCRFCQAGIIYRPVRQRSRQEILDRVEELINNCGYNEVSLVSLNTSDYSDIVKTVIGLSHRFQNLTLSLPSLYISSFTTELMNSLPSRKKTGLTFAPEAGSERLRRVINKDISNGEILRISSTILKRGWTSLKMYFMLGLPTETKDDVEDIIKLVDNIRSLGREAIGKFPQIRVNTSTFVPKPHTPFQWVAQVSEEELGFRHEILKQGLRHKGIRLSWHDPKTSLIEAALSRGDRRLGKIIYRAWELGSIFDSWNEQFNYDNWKHAFEEAKLDIKFYAQRERSLDELLPWGHIDVGVTTTFLKQEFQRATESTGTPDCRYQACNVCGLQREQPECLQKFKRISQDYP